MLVAALLALLLAGLGGLLFVAQESLVYFPDQTLRSSPADAGLAFEEVRLTTADGVRLAAWWVPSERPRGAVVLCHGNAGNRSDRLHLIALLARLGLDVLALDYRGYGGSGGRPSAAGTALDVDAALAHVWSVRGVSPARTVLYGESLGGAVAIDAAARHPVGALIAESTFTSVVDLARRYYPWAPRALITRVRYDPLATIPRVGCPILLLHSPSDSMIPFSMAERLLAAARTPAELVRIEGDHNDGGVSVSPAAQRRLAELLDAWLAY